MWKGCATAMAANSELFAAQLRESDQPTAAFQVPGLAEQVTGSLEIAALGAAAGPCGERANSVAPPSIMPRRHSRWR
jgi:hypothetical protein